MSQRVYLKGSEMSLRRYPRLSSDLHNTYTTHTHMGRERQRQKWVKIIITSVLSIPQFSEKITVLFYVPNITSATSTRQTAPRYKEKQTHQG